MKKSSLVMILALVGMVGCHSVKQVEPPKIAVSADDNMVYAPVGNDPVYSNSPLSHGNEAVILPEKPAKKPKVKAKPIICKGGYPMPMGDMGCPPYVTSNQNPDGTWKITTLFVDGNTSRVQSGDSLEAGLPVDQPKETYSFDGCNTTTYIDGNAIFTTLAYCIEPKIAADEGYQCTTNKSDKTITVTCVKSVEKAK